MSLIDDIRRKVKIGQFEFSKHAVDQSIIRRIGVHELHDIIANGTVIEDYPEDKYGSKLSDTGYDIKETTDTYTM